MGKPAFFLIGPPSRSASLLWRWLGAHRDVFMTARRELGFHAFKGMDPDVLSPIDPLLADAVTRSDEYSLAFRIGQSRLTGDASTINGLMPELAATIAADVPQAKVVITLEPPILRAFMAYHFNRTRGIEQARSFHEALALEPARLRTNASPFLQYTVGSRYRRLVEAYTAAFGRENVHIMIADTTYVPVGKALRDMCEFLGISPPPEKTVLGTEWQSLRLEDRFTRALADWRTGGLRADFRTGVAKDVRWLEKHLALALTSWIPSEDGDPEADSADP